jgi:hypothetical protein
MASANFRSGDEFEDDFVPDELVELSADESVGTPYNLEADAPEDEKRSIGQESVAANKRKRREKQKERKVLMTLSVRPKELMKLCVEEKSRPLQVKKSTSGWIARIARSRRIHLRVAI